MIFPIIIIISISVSSKGLILEGELLTKSTWEFIARFCYQTSNGVVDFEFEYPENYCCQDAILYYDSQWDYVYPPKSKTCEYKVSAASRSNNQILSLKDGTGGCKKVSTGGVTKILCKGFRTLSSTRARWWYLVISNCVSTRGLSLRYKMIMTNGDSFWKKHFSADEQNILETDIAFLFFQVILFICALTVAFSLHNRQLLHTTYKIYLWAVFLEILSIIVNMTYYVEYGLSGKPVKGVKNMGRGCHCISDTLMVVMLILLGKGWTVTRARISPTGQVKLAVFCTLYGIAYVALFIYEAKAFDPGKVLYIYESPAGIGICIMKVIAWLWFCYGIFFTLKNYAEKRFFYFPFFSFYTLWFLSGPIIVLIAAESIEPYVREQVMNGVDRTVALVAFAFFLMLTRPSAANKNFPYHVRTTQIGFIDESTNPNFETAVYKPSSETVEFNRSRMSSLFSVVSGDPSLRRGGSQSPLNPSASTTPVTGNSPYENGHSSILGYNNFGYRGEDPKPLIHQHSSNQGKEPSSNPNETLPPSYTSFQPPPYEFVASQSNFVTANGTMMKEQSQLNRSHLNGSMQQALAASSPPLVRTQEEVTSLFQAKSKSPSPPPPITPLPRSNVPSPTFNIPEPTTPHTNEEYSSSPSKYNGQSTIPAADLAEPDVVVNGTLQETTRKKRRSYSDAPGSKIIKEEETDHTVENEDDSPPLGNVQAIRTPRKKSRKKSKRKKDPEDPSHLPPISGATVLPPLRGGQLPSLKDRSFSVA